MTSPESGTNSSKPGFHVPYSYEDEDEDSENSSREASVEIVDCPVRVLVPPLKKPASTSADIEILSSQKAQKGHQKPREVYDLTLTTPDNKTQPRKADSESHLGSSQANPIDLEPERPAIQAEPIDDSDNEPPEVLPTSQESLKAMHTTRTYDPFRYYAPMVHAPSITAGVVATPKAPEDRVTEGMVADSQAEQTDNEMSYTSSDDELGPSSDVGSLKTSEPSCWGDEDQVAETTADTIDFQESSEDVSVAQNTAKPKVHFAADPVKSMHEVRVLVEDSQPRDRSQLRSSIADILDASRDTPGQTNKGKAIPMLQWVKPAPRAPSPSDAALARPQQTTSQHLIESNGNQMGSTYGEASLVSPWPRHNNQGPKETETSSLAWVHHYADAADIPASVNTNNLFVYSDLDAMDRALPRYDDGPFSGWTYALPNSFYNAAQYADRANMYPFTHDQFARGTDPDAMANNPATPRLLNLPNAFAQPSNASTGSSLQERMHFDQRAKRQGTSHTKPAKLPISDIVNQAPDRGTERELKRKADDMATDEGEVSVVPEGSPQVAAAVRESQDSHFPDAQPRDDLVRPENSLNDTVQQAELGITESDSSSLPDEPPAKRVKTSRGSSRPVKAFVSGVLVGCLSVAGACAAFLAAIPENVREEALREL